MKSLLNWFKGLRLRNKANGMAWICGVDRSYGGEALNGRAVRTVRLRDGSKWQIEPVQRFICTRDTRFQCGTLILAGDVAEIIAIADECLEPWKETGISESEVRELYEPRITTKETTS
jgi:hypothetical protein